MKLEVKLLSDTCPGSGEGVAGVIDTDIVFDEYGIPYIPSKRIKGCLKEAAMDLADIDEDLTSMIDGLFGLPGKPFGGNLKIGNGYIDGYEKFRNDIKRGIFSERYKKLFNQAVVKDYFSLTRTQTAIDGTKGIADESTLRITRVIKKGVSFYFDVDIDINDDNTRKKYKNFLKECCSVLRNIGINRTRGFGEVKCTLIDENNSSKINQSKAVVDKNQYSIDDNKVYCLPYEIKLNSPCVIDEDYISGGMVIGAFAGRYIFKNNINTKRAHENEEFRRLFLSDEVKYLNAYPVDENGIRLLPTPISLVKRKNDDGINVYDLSNDEAYDEIINEQDEQYTNVSYKFGIINEDRLKAGILNREIFYHHRRPDNRSIGHANEDSDFFQYEGVGKDQKFKGYILGSKKDLCTLKGLYSDYNTIRLGTSRHVQYGEAEINFEEIIDNLVEAEECGADNIVITLTSHMILENEYGQIEPDINLFLSEIGTGLEVDRCFIKTVHAGGFNSKWGMPKIQGEAIAAGSVIVLKEGQKIDTDSIANKSYGLRVNEGFGRIAVNYHGEYGNLTLNKTSGCERIEELLSLSELDEKVTRNYIGYALTHVLEQRLGRGIFQGEHRAENGENILTSGSSSAISNIIIMLRTSSNFDGFVGQLSNREEKNELIKKFKSRLTGQEGVPATFRNFVENVISGDRELNGLIEDYRVYLNDNSFLFSLFKKYYMLLLTKIKMEKRGE